MRFGFMSDFKLVQYVPPKSIIYKRLIETSCSKEQMDYLSRRSPGKAV